MPSNTSSRGSSSSSNKKDKRPENAAEIRRKRNPIFWGFSIVILVLILITFVVGPALIGMAPSQDSLQFGSYGGEPITYEYNNYFYHQHQNIASQWNQELSDENYQWQLFQIWRSAFNNTVVYLDLKQRAEAAGLQITDQRVQEYLLTAGPYINQQGEFDREAYSSTSASRRQEIVRQVRGELLQQKVASDLFSSKVSPDEAQFVFSLGKVEKRFDYVAFNLQNYPLDLTAEYADENEQLFRQIDLSMITLRDNLSEAETVRNRIISEDITFEEAARTYSYDIFAEDGGRAGWSFYHELREEFQDEVQLNNLFSLPRDGVSELVRTETGYALYRVNSPARAANLDNVDTLRSIRSYMARSSRAVVEDYFIEKAGSFAEAAANEGFASAASAEGLNVHSTGMFPLNYNGSMLLGRISQADPQGILSAASSNAFVLRELFARETGEITQPLTTGSNVIVAICREKQVRSDEEIAGLKSIYPYYVYELQQNDFSTMVLTSDKLEDNFLPVFINTLMR